MSGPAITRPAPPVVGMPIAVRLTDVSMTYGRGAAALPALDKVSLTARAGEFVCLVGVSGCGKSTLLSLVAGLDAPSAGWGQSGIGAEHGLPGLLEFTRPKSIAFRLG